VAAAGGVAGEVNECSAHKCAARYLVRVALHHDVSARWLYEDKRLVCVSQNRFTSRIGQRRADDVRVLTGTAQMPTQTPLADASNGAPNATSVTGASLQCLA
jgi:hypothetical protein